MLGDDTYRQLVELGARAAVERGEVMVGVGDVSFTRTRDRIRLGKAEDVDEVEREDAIADGWMVTA